MSLWSAVKIQVHHRSLSPRYVRRARGHESPQALLRHRECEHAEYPSSSSCEYEGTWWRDDEPDEQSDDERQEWMGREGFEDEYA